MRIIHSFLLSAAALLFCVQLALTADPSANPDYVKALPDCPPFNSDSYSGYVNVTGTSKRLHYMFLESQNDPANDPLIIWFNGGPGCSSMLGFFQESGPYVMGDNDAIIRPNKWAWNKFSNMLYFESPAGVGYSYGDPSEYFFNDDISGEDNLKALLSWFEKFPKFQNHDFYISGESYAGIYVPYLAYNVLKYNENAANPINLKGIMVGNGCTNFKYDTDPAFIDMAFYHALYNYELKRQIELCIYRYPGLVITDTPECNEAYDKFNNLTADINVYDIYRKCAYEDDNAESRYGETVVNGETRKYKRGASSREYTPWRFNQQIRGDGPILRDDPPCIFGKDMSDYFNREDVREALHIPSSVQTWELCTEDIEYYTYLKASFWIYPYLNGKIDILKFSGDTDGAVPTLGTMQWIRDLHWNITSPWRPWYVNGQVAGYTETRQSLVFATVHGAGHMAAQWKREQTWNLIKAFVNGEEF